MVAYISDEYLVLPSLPIVAGKRYNHAANIGKPVVYIYDPEKQVCSQPVSRKQKGNKKNFT